MRLAFMGTPAFSVPSLSELLASGYEIAAVYTQPPRPAGRGQKLRPSPVQEFAEAHGLPVRCPENFRDPAEKEAFAALDLDVAIVVAYGLILPKVVLEAPRHGCLNLHGSLLPRWRGAAPVQRAVMAGDEVTGIQVMQMERGLDTGPVLLSETVKIGEEETAGELFDRLALIGAGMLPRALAALERGGLTATAQSEEGVLYAEKISSEEARVDWTRSAKSLDCHIRGLSPFPGAWSIMTLEDGREERVKFLRSRVPPAGVPDVAAGVLLSEGDRLFAGSGEGAVEILQLQRAGKQAQMAVEFIRGLGGAVRVRLS